MIAGGTILCVDDEANVLHALRRLLRVDGYQIHLAAGAKEALSILAQHPVQVILTDQRMPGMTGTELLAQVKETHPHVIRAILSGYAEAATIIDALNRGHIFRFLTKPWNDDELRIAVRECFACFEAHKQIRHVQAECRSCDLERQRLRACIKLPTE